MAYQSPYKLLAGLMDEETASIDEETIVRLRKKLLAEFNLHNQTTIRINNRDYTKDEVLKLIDELKVIRDADIHLKIYKEPEVLMFLEDPIVNAQSDKKVFEWLNDPDTTPELAVLLREPLIEKMRYIFSKRLYANLLTMATAIYEGNDDEIKYRFNDLLYKYHHNNIVLIEEVRKSNTNTLPAHLNWLYDLGWAKFYNYIHKYHPQLIDEILGHCINLTVMLHRKSFNKRLLLKISGNMLFLKSEGENNRIAIDNHSAFMDKGSSGGGGQRWPVFIIVFVVLVVIRACFKLNDHKVKIKHYPLPQIKYDSNMFRPNPDTLILPVDTSTNRFR